MIPSFLVKPLIGVSVVALALGLGFREGYKYHKAKSDKAILEQTATNATRLAAIVIETEKRTRSIYEDKIDLLERAKNLPDMCILTGNFRGLHDSATGMPEVSTESPVSSKTVASTIVDNYAACRQNAEWLKECNRICK